MSAKLDTLPRRLTRAWRELTGASVVRANYHAAEYTRTVADWFSQCMAPDAEMRGEMRVMRARARDLARNDALVKQFLNILTSNVIGPQGPRLQARIRNANGDLDKKLNTRIEESWRRWSTRPITADGKLTLTEFAHLQLRTAARDGEGFTRYRFGSDRRFGLALQGVDPDLVDETYNHRMVPGVQEVRLGIEVNADVAPIGYWIHDRGMYETHNQTRPRYRLSADEVIHHFTTERVHQMRGMTWLAPVALLINHLERYNEAEVVAARAGATAVAFVVTTEADMSPNDEGATPGAAKAQRQLALNPGTIQRLAAGEDLKSFTPSHPTTAFADFNKSIMRRISTGLAVAYNTLCNDLEGVNYSSIRHGLSIERDGWLMLQEWWFSSFYTNVFEAWMQAATLSGELELPGGDWRVFADHRWLGRGWAPVDPLKDAEANQIELQNGLTSHQRILAPRGDDYFEILEELRAEQDAADEAGVNISGANIVHVPVAPESGDKGSDGGDGANGGSGDGLGGSSSRRADSGRRPIVGRAGILARTLGVGRNGA